MMNLSRDYYTTLDFNELKDGLKRKVGTNYKLGFIDNQKISLYYLKDSYTKISLDKVPTCKIEIKNEKQEDGRIRIKFVITEFSLIIVGLIPVIYILTLYFAKAPTTLYTVSGALYVILYSILVFILRDQSDEFETALKKLEKGTIN